MSSAISWLVDGSGGLQQSILLTLIRITLVLLAAWLVHGMWRRWNPRLRILLWRITAVGIVVVLTLSLMPARWNLPLLPPPITSGETSGVGQIHDVANAAVTAEPRTAVEPSVSQGLPVNRTSPSRSMVRATERSTTHEPTPSSVAPSEPRERDAIHNHRLAVKEQASSRGSILFSCTISAWGIGVAAISFSWLVGVWKLISVYRGASIVPAALQSQANTIAVALGYSGPIDIRHSGDIQTPCIVGAWRPRVLIPTRQCQLSEREELRASLAHELVHCQENDLRWNHLLTLVQAVLWFHPLAWRIRVAHADACDELCDAQAAAYLGDGVLYRRLLANLALRIAGQRTGAALAMARRSQVRKRIEAVGRNISSKSLTRWHIGTIVSCAALAAVLVGTGGISRSVAQNSQVNETEAQPSAEAVLAEKSESHQTRVPDTDGEVVMPILVKAATTGMPLSGAHLRFNGRIGGERFDARLTTNDNGLAELRRSASADVQHLWMTAKKSGYVPVHYVWQSEVKDIQLPERLDLELAKGLPIEGRVEDESGNPIAAAKVELTMPITWPGLANYVFTAAELTTDDEGRWTWDGAPEDTGSVSIRVEHSDYLRAGANASRGSGNIVVLKRGLEVRGRVVDKDGIPVEGATAQLGLDRFGTCEPKPKTDEEGAYVIKKCNPGPSAVTIQATGYSPEVKRIKVGESTGSVDFELGPAHVLRGKVVDVDGQPLSGVLVAPDTWRGFRTLENRMTTDDEGRFVWNGAPPDGVEYSILKEGYMARRNFVMTAEPTDQVVTLYPELQVSGRVTDGRTGEPVPEFAVRHGYLFTNSDRTYWSRDEGVPYHGGRYSYKFDEPMRGHLLQVVAAGYAPKTSRVFKSDEGKVHFDFELEPGQGPTGTIVTADGRPAVGAEVGLATREKRAFLDGGRFDRSQNQADVVSTDENGRFRFLPQDDEEYLLLVFHEDGFAEVTAEELATNDHIVLEPWGQLKGQVLLGDKPDVGREVSYSPRRSNENLISKFIWSYGYETKTDELGRFEFDRVIPGPGTLSRVVVTEFLESWQHSPCWQTPVEVQPHETTEVTIGGTGRPVSGRIVLERKPDVQVDWTTNEPATIERWNAQTGRRGDPYARYAANIDASGKFRIPDVPPGDYKLTVPVNNPPRPNACGAGSELGKAELVFSVPEMAEVRSEEVVDLGEISARLFDTLDAGEVAPDFVVERLDGGTLRMSDYRGQLVVLDFWATWCGPCLAEMPTFQKLQELFGENPRFALISLSCDNTAEVAREYVEANSLNWHHAQVPGTQAKAPRDYTVRSLPTTFLVAPDGSVLAKNLRGEDLVNAVAASLEDEDLFDVEADSARTRFPVVRFEAEQQTLDAHQPAVVVLDNMDPTFEKDQPHHDRLRLLDADGSELWSRNGFNNAGTVGGVHGVAVDEARGRIYVREDVTDRITAFDVSGQKLWQIDKIDAGCILVDTQTGNLWCSGGSNLRSGETVVFDPRGNELAAYPYRAIDMAYDPTSDAFWLVGYEIIKLSRHGDILFREAVDGWCCPSVSVNPNDGSVWIAERKHPDVASSRNRLWRRDADGSVLRQIDFGDSDIFVVACDPKSGDALFSGYHVGLRRVSVKGEPETIGDFQAKSIAIGRPSGAIWVATKDSVLRIDRNGKVLAELSFTSPSTQSWLGVF